MSANLAEANTKGNAEMNCKSINRNVWALILSTCLGVIFNYAGAGQAQERGTTNDRQLTSIETSFTQIENAKTAADKDRLADTLESRLAAYAKAMLESFDAALKQAETAAKSPVRRDSFELLKKFEDQLQSHERRLKRLDERAQKMKPSSSLQPIEDGKLAVGWRMLEKVSDSIGPAQESGKATLGWLLGKISDAVISPAQAAIALSIYNACSATPYNQAACIAATAAGHAQRIAAQNAFNACWNGLEGVRPKWWRAVRRAGCVTVLVARLA